MARHTFPSMGPSDRGMMATMGKREIVCGGAFADGHEKRVEPTCSKAVR